MFAQFIKRLGFHKSKDTVSIDRTPMLFPCGVSRSGTTLLSAALDAHSRVCMGYELLFKEQPGIQYMVDQVRSVQPDATSLKKAGSLLRQSGQVELGKWVSRCHRLGLGIDELLDVLEKHAVTNGDRLDSLPLRLSLLSSVMNEPGVRSGASHLGFKITDTAYETYLASYPNSYFVYIVRDPRDVYASLMAADFGVGLRAAAQRWVKGIEAFQAFQAEHPDQCRILRYEDLVQDPGAALSEVFGMAGLEMEDAVLAFQDSKARILDSSHPNAANLKKGFFGNSVGRYVRDLTRSEVQGIESRCGELMHALGYCAADVDSLLTYDIPAEEFKAKQKWLSNKRKYWPEDYEELLAPYLNGEYELMTLQELYSDGPKLEKDVLVIRHDVDHDHVTARKIAEWEHKRGIRATYCLLHTAWYYGKLVDGKMWHTSDLIETARYLSSLGHEINFHNNLVATALKHAADPVVLLKQELAYFRENGVEIKGTSTHGDGLCRTLNFRNWELFAECCDERFGGPRTLAYDSGDRVLEMSLGKHSMRDFGLEYEAYDAMRNIYHTDSGGNLRVRKNARGRRAIKRVEGTECQVVGVLTHPIWWGF